MFPYAQNKENIPFPGPTDLAGFLQSSEGIKNLKSLYKIDNSPGEWKVETSYYLYLSPGVLGILQLFSSGRSN